MMTESNTNVTDQTSNSDSAAQELRPSEVAERLTVSTATLRRWSRRFEPFLGLGDGSDGSRSHRRYSEADLETLVQVKSLLDQGWTYDQVSDFLQEQQDEPLDLEADRAELEVQDERPEGEPAISSEDANLNLFPLEADTAGQALAEPLPPAVQILRESLHNISESQQMLLNSQQANRDMLGVMIQDNLNLKDENTSLRDRMLEMEREMAELRRRHADFRERLETRVRVLEDAVARLMATQAAPTAPPAQSPQQPYGGQPGQPTYQQPEKRSFWSRLIGG